MKPKTEECKINTHKITEITQSSKVTMLKTEKKNNHVNSHDSRYKNSINVTHDEGNTLTYVS